jgi:hypothetical protein
MARTPDEEREYQRRHRRNVAERGEAKLRKCIQCTRAGIDKQAHDWAHVHDTDPDDVMNYVPLCKKCHGGYDKHTPEAIEKIRAASTGRRHTPESRAKMSEQKKAAAEARGPMPAEQREQIGDSLKGNTNAAGTGWRNEQALENMRAGQQRRRERERAEREAREA